MNEFLIEVGKYSEEWFKCCVCLDWIVPDVFSCEQDHYTCQICKPGVSNKCPECRRLIKLSPGVTRYAKNAPFEIPCRNREDGCNLHFVPNLLIKHMMTYCLYRKVECRFSVECRNEHKLVQLHLLPNHWRMEHGFDVSGEATEMVANCPVTFTYTYEEIGDTDYMWPIRRLRYKSKTLLLFVGVHLESDRTMFWLSSLEPDEADPEIFYSGTLSALNDSTVVTANCKFENLRANGILVHSCDQVEAKPHVSLSNEHMKQVDLRSNFWHPIIREGDCFSVSIAIN